MNNINFLNIPINCSIFVNNERWEIINGDSASYHYIKDQKIICHEKDDENNHYFSFVHGDNIFIFSGHIYTTLLPNFSLYCCKTKTIKNEYHCNEMMQIPCKNTTRVHYLNVGGCYNIGECFTLHDNSPIDCRIIIYSKYHTLYPNIVI